MKRLSIFFPFLLCGALAACGGELETARAALRDGLWDVARSHARQVLTNDAAKVVVLESYAREDRWEDVAKALSEWTSVRGPAFDYYRAASSGDYVTALKLLQETTKAGDPADAEVKMMEAFIRVKAGDQSGAEELWREVTALTNAGERAFTVACVNLGDADLLRRAYGRAKSTAMKQLSGLRLGQALLRDAKTSEEGERLIRAIAKDSPDADGAMMAFVALGDAAITAEKWSEAAQTYHDAIETWPEAAKLSQVQEGRGWAQLKLGKRDEALASFKRAEELAKDDEQRAVTAMKQGDVLAELGRGDEAMAKYREIVVRYPKTVVAEKIKRVVRIRELESSGREHYKGYRFGAAQKAFAEVAAADPARKPRMEQFDILCLYGQGRDDEAESKARALVAACPDAAVRADVTLWLAKFLYNRRQWKESGQMFLSYAELASEGASAPEALMWAARAAFAENDFARTIQMATRLAERYPDSAARSQAMLVQAEALIELARFDEAVLVLERVAISEGTQTADRTRAQVLKSDALFAMGADNPTRYVAALEEYRALRFGGSLSPSRQLSVSFKIGRTLEKLKRIDEAVDQYYTQVVLAYRDGRARGERYDDEARAAFSRAAFWLADEYESRGKDYQTMNILELVAESDVPAAEEARKRIDRLSKKGRFL